MCPPAQPPRSEIGLYWSDEQIVLFLAEYSPGSLLPDNVLPDSSPYQYRPSDLPEGMWYLVRSNEKKECAFGFWKAKGEACKVYSNGMISGWRTTLEYFEGLAPHGQITDWLMQEYRITQKKLGDKDKPKESRLLCRVFLCSGHSSKSEMNLQNCKTIIESKNMNPVASFNPSTNITSVQDSGSESKSKTESEVGAFPVEANTKPNSSPQAFWEQECISKEDYLELDDLEDPISHSSSSQNSSCPSKLSDEYFDSSAFLRIIEEEDKKQGQHSMDYLELNDLEDPESHSSPSQNSSCPSKLSDEYFDSSALLRAIEEGDRKQGQHSSSRYSVSTSVVPNGVILQPAFSGSVFSGSVRTDVVEALRTSSANRDSLTDKRVQEHTTKQHNPEIKTESTSKSYSVEAPSTSRKNAVPSGEKKAGAGKMKILKNLFCFSSF